MVIQLQATHVHKQRIFRFINRLPTSFSVDLLTLASALLSRHPFHMKLFSPMEPSSACSYVATQRGGVALLFEGHRYNKVRDGKDGTVYWRCSRDRQCPGRAVTVNNRVKKSNNKHNHPPEASLLMRNGGTGHGNSVHHPPSHHHSNNQSNSASAMAAAAAAAAAYASFLQGSNNSSHHNSVHSKSTSIQQAHSPQMGTAAQSRPPPHHSPSTASSSSPSPLGLTAGLGPVPANNAFSSAFSFLHNLAASAGSNTASHLLSGSLLNNHSADNGRQALNLSSHGVSNHSPESNHSLANARLPFNHLSNFNLLHHRPPLDSPAKMAPNSPPPTPTSNNSAIFAKSLQSQYNCLLKGGNPFSQTSNSTNSTNSNCTLDLSPHSFAFGQSAAVPSNMSSGRQSLHIKSELPLSPPPATPNHENMAAFMLQDALQEAQAAAVAAAAFPSLLTETFKYLAAAASTNPQMAAALAANLSSPTMLKNFDLTMATAAAAAVAAAANQSNTSNGTSNGDSSGPNKSHGALDLIDHSPYGALRELTGGRTTRDQPFPYKCILFRHCITNGICRANLKPLLQW